jgi:DNA-binding transcriptional regulator GbsR (MarR family)
VQSELDLLLGTAINSLVKLDALLYLHERPGTAQSPDEIAARVQRRADQLEVALRELSEVGLIERFAFGSGRHAVYGASEDAHVQELLVILRERYHRDPEARSQIVRDVMQSSQREEDRGSAAT